LPFAYLKDMSVSIAAVSREPMMEHPERTLDAGKVGLQLIGSGK